MNGGLLQLLWCLRVVVMHVICLSAPLLWLYGLHPLIRCLPALGSSLCADSCIAHADAAKEVC